MLLLLLFLLLLVEFHWIQVRVLLAPTTRYSACIPSAQYRYARIQCHLHANMHGLPIRYERFYVYSFLWMTFFPILLETAMYVYLTRYKQDIGTVPHAHIDVDDFCMRVTDGRNGARQPHRLMFIKHTCTHESRIGLYWATIAAVRDCLHMYACSVKIQLSMFCLANCFTTFNLYALIFSLRWVFFHSLQEDIANLCALLGCIQSQICMRMSDNWLVLALLGRFQVLD